MKRTIYPCILLTACLAGVAPAQEARQERDPFFPEGPRTAPTETVRADVNAGFGRDPFTRPFEERTELTQTQASGTPGRNLTGIIYGKNVRIAVIGGEMLREGSMVGDRKLVDIRQRSVVLMDTAGNTEEIVIQNFSIRK